MGWFTPANPARSPACSPAPCCCWPCPHRWFQNLLSHSARGKFSSSVRHLACRRAGHPARRWSLDIQRVWRISFVGNFLGNFVGSTIKTLTLQKISLTTFCPIWDKRLSGKFRSFRQRKEDQSHAPFESAHAPALW